MNSKSLLIYGYALPCAGASLVAILPILFDGEGYLKIATAFQEHIALAIGFIAIAVSISIQSQSKVMSEDNPIVLQILEGTEVRKVFMNAFHYQLATIFILGLFLLLGSTFLPKSEAVGALLLFSSGMIGFETFSIFSTGRAYTDIREKIILKTKGSQQSH